uniref:Uncharacterized protein n=1 Tax=Cannabis sativa TaxID=3483 RepID=A0A803PRE5_CANSA
MKRIVALADLEKNKTEFDTVKKDLESTKATLEKAKKAMYQDNQENCAMKDNLTKDALLVECCANTITKLALELENVRVERNATESESIAGVEEYQCNSRESQKALHQDTQENCAMIDNFAKVQNKKVGAKIESTR